MVFGALGITRVHNSVINAVCTPPWLIFGRLDLTIGLCGCDPMGWQQLSPTCACFAVPCCCQGLSFVHRSIAHGSMAFAGLGKAGTNACSNHFRAVLPSQMIPGAQVTGECPGCWNGPFTASCASSSCGSKTHLFLPSSQPHHLKVFQISFPEVSNLLEYFEVRTSRCAHS